jgi:hypothetical protein
MKLVKLLLCLVVLFSISACTSQPKTEIIYKDRIIVLEVSDSVYKAVKKPTTFKEDINLEYLESVDVTDKELITILLHRYAIEKNNNLTCYSTLYNVKQSLQKQKEAALKGNASQ